jgi:hypothetical protein
MDRPRKSGTAVTTVPLFPDKYNVLSQEQVHIDSGVNVRNFELKSK